jgi:hypothetical protein
MRRNVLISAISTIPVISAVTVAGCATGHSGTVQPSSESVRIVGSSSSNLRMSPGEGAKEAEIPASIDQVWKVLPQIYDSLGIEIDNLDEARRVIGHSGSLARRCSRRSSTAAARRVSRAPSPTTFSSPCSRT